MTERVTQLSAHLTTTYFGDIAEAPADAIFALTSGFKNDANPKKVNLGVGAYRDNEGKPWVLPVVKKADRILMDKNVDHEYLPIAGLASYTSAAAKLILGPSADKSRLSSLQSISGTGALHLGALFLHKFYKGPQDVYISSPTWANHRQLFENVGTKVKEYPYFDKKTKGLDYEGYKKALLDAPERSIFVIHACAHNPTGVDPTQDQWREIASIIEIKKHFPFFDCAYQGFASGSLDRDAWAVRYFYEKGFEMCIAQSFAKNFGLYGERTGGFHFVSRNAEVAKKVKSQLEILQRSEISNPPAYGARIVDIVLNNPELFNEWNGCLDEMSGRIKQMRKALYDALIKLDTPGTWNHITDQIGMFSFLGLSPTICDRLIKDFHIYLTKNARISVAGLNTSNVQYVAESISTCVKDEAKK